MAVKAQFLGEHVFVWYSVSGCESEDPRGARICVIECEWL